MSQTEPKNISKIVSISVAVLGLILLLMYMQGSFVSKVPPGLSPQASDSNTPKSQTALVEKKQAIPDKDEEINGVKIEWRASDNRIRIDFGQRVPMDTYKELKRHGYRAMKEEGVFSAYYNYNAGEFVTNLRK